MARVLPRYLADIRHLLLALLAVGLVLRMGAGCEAMAATPAMPMAMQSHCAEMPAKPGKPIKADAAACALCIALPDAAVTKANVPLLVAIAPIAGLYDGLAGLSGGPAPPPPKIA
ncbi:hypothetical protein ASE86_06275 [Sphingomonas sp. Leaf33]|uniref:hypothetical protein n=1 Tax=Sphingomonas sp. Leaf33 TaxID=1736215 RepID=UPI0006FDB502|nr:hypothetical protein [Sphingomonas sp. Leaf33]KQN25805.1 hypothetical protein ASE86_06275 [Sphingomonas sp. Leaf33]